MFRLHERLPVNSVRDAATSNISAPDCSGTAVVGAAGLAQRTRVPNPAPWGQGPHPGSLCSHLQCQEQRLGKWSPCQRSQGPSSGYQSPPPASAGKRAHLRSQDQGHGQQACMALKSESQMREQELCQGLGVMTSAREACLTMYVLRTERPR